MNLQTLKTELALPKYSAMTDQQAADDLNAVNVDRIRAAMSGSEMWANTDPTEYATLTDTQKAHWLAFCAIDSHNPENNGLAHQFVLSIFGTGATLTALAAVRSETISRSTELGLGFVKLGYVEEARRI